MRTRSKKILAFLALVALTAFSTIAMAQTPGRVGRIALIQGQVNVADDQGDGFSPALLNWPVTSHNQITTGRDARTEIKIGSTAIRLDGDSSLEVTELDDDTMRLHLHYGSVSVHLRNPEVLAGFRLSTPQGQVRMQEPGRVRVDAERVPDTTVINVFDGVALVDGNSSSTTVRANRRAELQNDDMRTGLAARDSFDDWAYLRDQRDERVTSDRYVTREMTGYEDLDQYGVWREDREHGPLWLPRSVPANWAPYRDGRWAWVSPWGWTWVDNAPWGYAPFHYGRWVEVNSRWCWAPGRTVARPVWAPALVGWVGGSNWQLTFSSGRRPAPATGWYPLGPRHAYTPAYRASPEHVRWINRHSHPDDHHRSGPDRRFAGITVVPHDQFSKRGTIIVPNVPRAIVPGVSLQVAPVVAAPVPVALHEPRGNRDDRFGRPDRGERNDQGHRNDPGNRNDWRGRNERPVAPAAPLAAQPQPQQPVQVPHRDPRADDRNDRNDRNDRFDRNDQDKRNDWRGRSERPAAAPIAVQQQPAPQQPAPQPVPAVRNEPPREGYRRDDNGRVQAAPPQAQPAPQQFSRPQPQVQPPPQPHSQAFSRPAPQPQPQAQPQAQPAPVAQDRRKDNEGESRGPHKNVKERENRSER